jgi:NADPH-dependent 2,4-dienoyl-CoA reductase/sulfur reductase-like enzyme/rhodanese-related sulfurtransferase
MKIVIIGGVAAGPKAAARIRRLDADAEITVIEKGEFLSYAGCGLPYYVSGVVKEQAELMSTPVGVIRDPSFFKNVKDIKVLNHTEAKSIDRKNKTVTIKQEDGSIDTIEYDKLVMATGATPFIPELPGGHLKNIYKLYGVEDAEGIKATLSDNKAKDVVIVGGGLIGVEMAEALVVKGCRVTMVELLPQIMTILDPEMAVLLTQHMESKGVKVMTNTKVLGFDGKECVNKVKTDKHEISADMVIMSIGVRPTTKLAFDAGLEIGSTRAIQVNEQMQTSDKDIYAVGDCAQKTNLVTGTPCYVPLGSTANKEGRVAANDICGVDDKFEGVLGSAICKVFDFAAARTGLSEQQAIDAGYDVETCLSPAPDKPHFMPTAKLLMLKLIADKKTKKLLGAQAIGPGDSAKRLDIAVTAITAGMTLSQIAKLDLCYAPPFSPAMDNLITAANILENKIDGAYKGITFAEVKAKLDNGDDFTLLDVRGPSELEAMKIDAAVNIPLGKLRNRLNELDKDKEIVTFCKISLKSYEAALILQNAGFTNVKVMDGGLLMWPYKK